VCADALGPSDISCTISRQTDAVFQTTTPLPPPMLGSAKGGNGGSGVRLTAGSYDEQGSLCSLLAAAH